jgi:uncharacterized protein (UPF0332 family)
VTDAGRKESAAEELARSAEEIQAAEHLLAAGLARVALARVYFAVFHAVRGRLYADGHEPKTHSGTHQLFNQQFVKTGRYPATTSRLLARLQKFREEADYGETFVIDVAGATEELTAALELIALIARISAPERSVYLGPEVRG